MSADAPLRVDAQPGSTVKGASSGSSAGHSRHDGARLVFVLLEIVGGLFWLWWGRHSWFRTDDWDFLAARSAGNVGDIFRAHYGHWTTLPVLEYRAL